MENKIMPTAPTKRHNEVSQRHAEPDNTASDKSCDTAAHKLYESEGRPSGPRRPDRVGLATSRGPVRSQPLRLPSPRTTQPAQYTVRPRRGDMSEHSEMRLEKIIITEFVQLYREYPCLWDSKQPQYTNRAARDHAYEVLLEKYKELEENATIMDVKKKVEHMRATYRREHKKVLLSRLNGDDEEHVPQLWYYELFTFLNDAIDFTKLTPNPSRLKSSKLEYVESPPKRKRMSTMSSVYLQESDNPTCEYLEDEDHIDGDQDTDHSNHLEQENENSAQSLQVNVAPDASESQAFGTTVGLQLKELDTMQRVIAEKLISDVIFAGRLNRLSIHTMLKFRD